MDDGASSGSVRKARITDAAAIQRLVGTFAERDEMLPRSLGEIYENIRDFFVAEDDDGNLGGFGNTGNVGNMQNLGQGMSNSLQAVGNSIGNLTQSLTGGNILQVRSEYYYKQYGQDAIEKAGKYADDMKDYLSDGTFPPGANKDGLALGGAGAIGGDNIGTLPVYYDPGDKTRENHGGKASGGEDDRQSNVNRSTYPDTWR